MKKILFMFLAMGLFFAFTERSYSVQNNLNFHFASEGGEIEPLATNPDADSAQGEFGIEYIHYFSDLTRGDGPIDMREFLQHPSNFFVSSEGTATAIDYDAILDEEDTRQSMFILGGEYYFNDTTGLNLALVSTAIEIEDFIAGVKIQDIDIAMGGLMFGVNHYIKDNVSISANFMSISGEADVWEITPATFEVDITQKIFSFGVEAFLNGNISVAAEITTGEFEWDDPTIEDSDISGHSLHLGYFTSNNNEIYFFHENYEMDRDAEEVINGIGDKIYITENFFLKGELYGVNVEYIDHSTWDTEERGGIDLEVGFYF